MAGRKLTLVLDTNVFRTIALIAIALHTTAVAQPSQRVKVTEVPINVAKKQASHPRWVTKNENKTVVAKVWQVVDKAISPYAADTDEQDSYLWIRTTDKRQVSRPVRMFKVGPFFAPEVFLWVNSLPNESACILTITYLTTEKKYGSLKIVPDSVSFTEGKGKVKKGLIKVNIPDSVLPEIPKKH
jgi:hypothetical protein